MSSKSTNNANFKRKNLLYLSFLTKTSASTVQNIDASQNFLLNIDDVRNYDMPNLQSLNLSCNLINNIDGFKYKQYPKLVELDLYGNQISDISSLKQMVAPLLVMLRLGFSKRGNKIQDIRPMINNFENLEQLTLDFNQLNGSSVEELSLSCFTQLKLLYISGNSIQFFNPKIVENLKNLQLLSLKQNLLTHNGFMAKLNLPFLTYLNLSHNYIINFQPLPHAFLPKLTRLALNKNITVNYNIVLKGDWQQIQEAYLYDMGDLYTKSLVKKLRQKKIFAN